MDAVPPTGLLDRPLRDLNAWADHFSRQDIPVLQASARAIETLAVRDDEGDEGVDAHLVVRDAGQDPLLVLRVLRHVATALRSGRDLQVETLTEALVLMGITPFFRAFRQLPTLESHLAALPWAAEGFERVLRRGQRAGQFALGFAVQRLDQDAPVIHQAAMLHDFAELLLWVHAPALAADIALRQARDATLRSVDAQRAVLGIELNELQQELMKRWRLPELLVRLGDDRHAESPSVRCVALGVRAARHTASGWHNAALPDDCHDIGELLQISPEAARRLLIELDS